MKRFPLWVAALAAAALISGSGIVRAGDPAPASEPTKAAAPAEAPAAAPAASDDAKATPAADATKTGSPIHTMMGWVAKQVMPGVECPCPSKADGETAWRAWFAGGAEVPLAGLRDAMVADGWTADKFVGFFQAAAKAQAASGEGCHGSCPDKAGADAKGGPSADAGDGGCKDCPNAGKCDGGGCKDCPNAGKCDGGGCKDCPNAGKCGEGAGASKPEGGCSKGQCPSTKPAPPAESAPKP